MCFHLYLLKFLFFIFGFEIELFDLIYDLQSPTTNINRLLRQN